MVVQNTSSTPAPEINLNTKTSRYRMRFKRMLSDASTWRSHWSEVNEFFTPRRGKYLTSDFGSMPVNDGRKKNQKTINTVAFDAADTFAALLQNGLCPRDIPWFALSISDRRISESKAVKIWLTDVRDTILAILEKSNFYNAIYGFLKEFGVFGIAAMLMEEDTTSIMRFLPFTIGEYFIDVDAYGTVTALYRRFSLNARQAVDEFGIDNVSAAIKAAYDTEGDAAFTIIHAIQLNAAFDPTVRTAKGKRWESVYYEDSAADQDRFLSVGGFRTCPFTAPRWDAVSSDSYGDSPGIRTLADVKMLQKLEEKKIKAVDKEVDPPMNVPTALRGRGATSVAGGANYVDLMAGQSGVTPVMQIRTNLQNTAYELERVEKRINHGMYVDLIQMLLDDTKRRTAYEIMIQNSDRLQRLIPGVGRIQTEFLNSVVNRGYDIGDSFGAFEQMPPELMGMDIKITYTSQLAIAMKIAQRVRPIGDFLASAAGVCQFDPTAVHKINGNELMDILADAHGVPPSAIRSDDEVAQIMAVIQQQQQQAAQMQAGMAAADAANKLGNTPTGQGSVLDKMTEGAA